MASEQQNPNDGTNNNSNTMINTFMEITSSTLEEAQFFLESHNFDLDNAVSTFFESHSSAIVEPPQQEQDHENENENENSSSPSFSPSRSRSHSPQPGAETNSRARRSSQYNLRARRGNIRSFSDLNSGNGSGSDSDSEKPNQYFTGGQKSGMLVQDPSRGNDVDAIFEQARQMGATTEVPPEVYQPSSSSRSFTGTARLLSGEMVTSAPQEQPPASVTHTITFWQNGFTVDDGPLRRFDDPENAIFLESIKKSECPKELEPADRRTKVHIRLMREDEKFPELQKRKTPFQGVGRTLGTSSSSSTPDPSANPTALSTAPAPVMGLVVDENSPSTSIQLRLADGTRMVSRFNNHHTVRDIHGFIDASRPGRVGSYTLQTVGFPPKKLTELDQTIEQAGLANSVVIQKFWLTS